MSMAKRWDTVKEIHKRHLRRKYKSFNLKKIHYLAMYEVYLDKKRKYITIVLDLRSGRILHVGQGKRKRRMKRSKVTIEAVDSRSLLKRGSYSPRGGLEAICMEAEV